MIKLGITGTDTGVGKTVVACALVSSIRAAGLRVAVMKPVETGVERGVSSSDHARLAAAASVEASADVCPIIFAEPVAPWVAARRAGEELDIAKLDAAFSRNCESSDAIIVEGAGGLLVPLTKTLRYDGLFARWDLDIMIVAPNRLGVINHALMTVESARRAGLGVRALVLNDSGAGTNNIAAAENARALKDLLDGIPVVEFHCLQSGSHTTFDGLPVNFEALGEAAVRAGLTKLVLDN